MVLEWFWDEILDERGRTERDSNLKTMPTGTRCFGLVDPVKEEVALE